MDKFIISSVALHKFFDKIYWESPKDDSYELKVRDKTLSFGKYKAGIEPNTSGPFNLKVDIHQIERIRKILKQIEDQPLVCGMTSEGWFSISQIVI